MRSLWIGVAGFAGAVSRYQLEGWISRHAKGAFPWGTLLVNLFLKATDTEIRRQNEVRWQVSLLGERLLLGGGLIFLFGLLLRLLPTSHNAQDERVIAIRKTSKPIIVAMMVSGVLLMVGGLLTLAL